MNVIETKFLVIILSLEVEDSNSHTSTFAVLKKYFVN